MKFDECIIRASKAGDLSFSNGIQLMKEHVGKDGIPAIGEFEKCADAARSIIYGDHGIAIQLKSTASQVETLDVLELAMETFFSQDNEHTGQLARTYAFGFATLLKNLDPDFKRLLEEAKVEKAPFLHRTRRKRLSAKQRFTYWRNARIPDT